MKLQSFFVRASLLFSAAILTSCYFAPRASAQQPDAEADNATQAKFPAAKRFAHQPAAASHAAQVSQSERQKNQRKDSADEIRKREEWFYKPRASANGHIPAGARTRALQHMRQMMIREGKLVQRPDGSYAEVAPELQPSPLGAVTSPWTSIGPTPTTGGTFSPVTGRITTIAVDPSDTTGNTVLIGGAQGGIWRSTDAGATWTAVGDQNASLAMGSIAFANPTSPGGAGIVYAGTGEQASIGFDIYYGAGVLKSTDSGQTWTQTCTTPSTTCPFIGPTNDLTPFGFFTSGGTRISYIAVNPANPSMVLVAAQTQFAEGPTEGVYCSADGGGTWNLVSSASGEMSTFVGFASSSIAFAALGNPFGTTSGKNGIYKSTTATSCSLTFSQLTSGLPAATSIGRIDMGISPLFATDNTVYASIADASNNNASGPNLGVFVSTNGGTTWTQTAAPDICQQQCWYDNVIKVDPNGGAHAFFGGGAVTDASNNPIWVMSTATTGATWTSVIPNVQGPGLPHVDNHAFAFAKLSTGKIRMYLGNDGGIWRTDDAEAASVAWTNLNDSLLTLTQFYPAISIHPSSQLFAFAGAQDNGSQIYDQPLTANSWTDNGVCGDGTGTAIDNVIPSTVYVTCNGDFVNASQTNGAANSYVPATGGINLGDNSNFVPPLVTDPNTANAAYLGTTKVYQTITTGISWTALSSDLVNGGNGDSLTAMAVAPGNSSVVYAGADTGQIFVATNVSAGAGSFNPVTGQASLPPRQVSAIAVDPADSTGRTAYAAFSGFSFVQGSINDPTGHLFKTTDAGATWTDVSCQAANCSAPNTATDLPNTPVNDVVVDPDIAGTLYVGTDIGVFQGTCTTTAPFTCMWATLMPTTLPRVAVLSLKLHRASRTLFAATHGRGTWTIQLNNFLFTGPHISSISPVSVLAGAGAFTLTVNGSGLTGGTVQWNGATTGVTQGGGSDTQLTATIATSLTGGGAAAQVTVNVGTTASNALTFTVLAGPLSVNSPVSPASAPVNTTPGTTITVNGTGFASNAKVVMNPDGNGTILNTTFVSSTKLTATVPPTFMANFGSTNSVGVQNPPPGGGLTVTTSTVTLPTFVVAAPAPANDNFASATSITSTNFTDTKDSSGATTQAADPVPACSQIPGSGTTTGINNTIWYKFVPTGTGMANIDTIGSSYDSVLSVWSGTSQSALSPVACNDDINPGLVVQSQLTNVTLTAGTTYYIMVSSFGALDPNPLAFGGKSVLNFSFTGSSSGGTATTTTVTSSSTNIASGGSITLTATVVGSGTGASPTGTVQFMNGTTPLGTAQTCSAVSGATSPTCKATLTTTLAFLVPPSGPQRMPGFHVQPVFLVLAVVLLVLLILGLPRIPVHYRRAYASIVFLLLVGCALGMVACGGGYGGGGGGGLHYDTITGVYSGDATYAGSTSPSITITVQ